MEWLRAALLAVAVAVAGRAQDGASTLAANLDTADAVVVATVTEHENAPQDMLRVRMAVTTTVAGSPPAAFTLVEPAGACCGRSLFALQQGDVRLAFLSRRGPTWHVVGGPRGLLPATAELVAHVQALAAHRSGPARTALLVAALADDEPRIADDAALALAAQPTLALDAQARAQVGEALQRELDRRSVRAAPLLEVAARSADAGLRDALLERFLASPRDDEAALLANGLLRTPVAGTMELAIAGATDERRGLRAAELASGLGDDAAVAACFGLLGRTRAPRVQLRLCEELLARGVPAAQLHAAPRAVVDGAKKRVAARSLGRTATEAR
jgi:hypothetical protein